MPNVLQVGELQMELMRTSTQSNAAIQHFEQTIALLTAERGAAEQAADQARQAATAADLRVKQLQGELAAAASEREWAQESTGALQVGLGVIICMHGTCPTHKEVLKVVCTSVIAFMKTLKMLKWI